MYNWKKIFAIIWSGQAFSLLSSSIVQFAIVWWLTAKTGSAGVLAGALIVVILPQIVLGPFIGVWVDRWNRKTIMIAADSFIAFCSVITGLLFYFDVIALWHIYTLLIARSIGEAFHYPAMQASVPLLAPEEQLTRIAGINQGLWSVGHIGGPALGALLVTLSSMPVIMLIDVAGALLAVVSLLFVHIPRPPKTSETHAGGVLRELWAAFKVIHANKGLFLLILMFVLCVFISLPVNALFPLMTFNHFGGGAWEMGAVEVAAGVGMLLGAALIGWWGGNTKQIVMINLAYVALGLSFFLSGFLPSSAFWWFVGCVMLSGLAMPFFNSPITAIIQRQVEPGMLGRVFSLFDTLSLLPGPFGLMATGFIADAVGIAPAFAAGGALIILVGLISFCIPPLMRLDKQNKK